MVAVGFYTLYITLSFFPLVEEGDYRSHSHINNQHITHIRIVTLIQLQAVQWDHLGHLEPPDSRATLPRLPSTHPGGGAAGLHAGVAVGAQDDGGLAHGSPVAASRRVVVQRLAVLDGTGSGRPEGGRGVLPKGRVHRNRNWGRGAFKRPVSFAAVRLFILRRAKTFALMARRLLLLLLLWVVMRGGSGRGGGGRCRRSSSSGGGSLMLLMLLVHFVSCKSRGRVRLLRRNIAGGSGHGRGFLEEVRKEVRKEKGRKEGSAERRVSG